MNKKELAQWKKYSEYVDAHNEKIYQKLITHRRERQRKRDEDFTQDIKEYDEKSFFSKLFIPRPLPFIQDPYIASLRYKLDDLDDSIITRHLMNKSTQGFYDWLTREDK